MKKAFDRASDFAVLPVILNRWSPRAFQPVDIRREELLGLLEAGRWAPSAYNRQPWRFIFARRNAADWERFLSWLIPFNRTWAENASAIVYIVSRTITISPKTGESVPSPTHAFDAGAASALIQIQAVHSGWSVHPASGFEHDLAHAGLELPEDYQIHAALLIGRRGDAGGLPEALREREYPSGRLSLDEIAFEGRGKF
ncbi:nitroreductase family protein [Acetobacter persici]|uniref:nitroreductase family protein n=1 Tax=Acetobacter persici TaxID=1076596 RepID=UPI001BACA01A|nr:nitroreductase family protein [Acetobacter persici]MBS0964483.1 nitroreductase family protein [Acetobacter persici]